MQHGTSHGIVDALVARVGDVFDVRAQATRAVRRVEARSAEKGFSFEDVVAPVVERAFAPYGDIVENTSGTPGLDGSVKKGDFTVTLNPETTGGRNRCVVVEAKDRPAQKLTGKEGALPYLSLAMENRQAEAAVMVCATATPALDAQRLRVYPGNRILALLNKDDPDPLALEIACHLARTLAMSAVGDEDPGIDDRLLADRVRRLHETIERASCIHSGVLKARRGLNDIENGYDELRNSAMEVLYELEDRLS